MSVIFADGTSGEATYSRIAGKWDSTFTGYNKISPDQATGFFSEGCDLEYLYHRYTDGLPLAWEDCKMKFSSNFELDQTINFGSNFGASASGWNYADFKICCISNPSM